jgi:hypothetical protein
MSASCRTIACGFARSTCPPSPHEKTSNRSSCHIEGLPQLTAANARLICDWYFHAAVNDVSVAGYQWVSLRNEIKKLNWIAIVVIGVASRPIRSIWCAIQAQTGVAPVGVQPGPLSCNRDRGDRGCRTGTTSPWSDQVSNHLKVLWDYHQGMGGPTKGGVRWHSAFVAGSSGNVRQPNRVFAN